jgi:hypothetical protein
MRPQTHGAITPFLTAGSAAPGAGADLGRNRTMPSGTPAMAPGTVAQAVKIAFSADSVINMIVITSSICSSRLITGLTRPPASLPVTARLTVAWTASTATMPQTVTAMLVALSRARRGLRAAGRSPNSAGTGSLLDGRISVPWRRGGRAGSASALTVLLRGPDGGGRAWRRARRRAPLPAPPRPSAG